MSDTRDVMRYVPRALGMGMVLFLGLFALDAFQDEGGVGGQLKDFVLHLLPAALCLCVVLLAWKREAVGATAFTVLAVGYALWAMPRWDWIAVISGALLLAALVYGVVWWILRSRVPEPN